MPLLKFWAVKKLSENFPPHPPKKFKAQKNIAKRSNSNYEQPQSPLWEICSVCRKKLQISPPLTF